MKATLFLVILFITFSARAQKETEKTPAKTNAPIVAYGEPISLAAAKKVLSAAEAFALNNQWTMVIAIVDTGGNLVALGKMDNTQLGSIDC